MKQQDKLTDIFEFSFSAKLKEDLRITSIWAMITAIISFVSTAFTMVSSLRQGSFLTALIVGAVNVTVGIYLLNFGRQSKKGLDSTDQSEMEEGLNNLRLYFKVWCILLMIGVSILFLSLIVALLRLG